MKKACLLVSILVLLAGCSIAPTPTPAPTPPPLDEVEFRSVVLPTLTWDGIQEDKFRIAIINKTDAEVQMHLESTTGTKYTFVIPAGENNFGWYLVKSDVYRRAMWSECNSDGWRYDYFEVNWNIRFTFVPCDQ